MWKGRAADLGGENILVPNDYVYSFFVFIIFCFSVSAFQRTEDSTYSKLKVPDLDQTLIWNEEIKRVAYHIFRIKISACHHLGLGSGISWV